MDTENFNEHLSKAEEQSTEESQNMQQQPEILQTQLNEAGNNIVKLKDQLLRKAAEFENYKRRIEEEKSQIIKYAKERLLFEILPIVDDVARSLQAGKEHTNFDTFYAGIELIFSKLNKLLDANGVKSFDSVGKEFDVKLHDVLLSVPRNDVAHHIIVEEVMKGYMVYDKVLRHSKVIVAENEIATTEQPQENISTEIIV
ncbi:MAG: nucleotide exchange factor GrpE [Ignavibacteria bacterium]|nr:nucleotide exchange factor GrpE [Ignavibacteria bacterium]